MAADPRWTGTTVHQCLQVVSHGFAGDLVRSDAGPAEERLECASVISQGGPTFCGCAQGSGLDTQSPEFA
jgi:hypothetical protein